MVGQSEFEPIIIAIGTVMLALFLSRVRKQYIITNAA